MVKPWFWGSTCLFRPKHQCIRCVFCDCLVAEPPVELFTAHEGSQLIVEVPVESAARDTTRQHGQDFVWVTEVDDHAQRR